MFVGIWRLALTLIIDLSRKLIDNQGAATLSFRFIVQLCTERGEDRVDLMCRGEMVKVILMYELKGGKSAFTSKIQTVNIMEVTLCSDTDFSQLERWLLMKPMEI